MSRKQQVHSGSLVVATSPREAFFLFDFFKIYHETKLYLLCKFILIATKEKLEIVIGVAEPRLGAGFFRHRRRRKRFALSSK